MLERIRTLVKISQNRIRLALLTIGMVITSLLLSGCALDKNAQDTRWLVVATSQDIADSGLPTAVTPAFEAAQHVRVKWLTVSSCQALNYISRDSRIDVLLVSGGDQLDKAVGPDYDFCKPTLAQTPNPKSGSVAGPAPTLPPFDSPPLTPTPVPTMVAGAPPLPTSTALDVKYLLAERHTVFWSPLVLVGPAADPLHLAGAANIAKALRSLASQNGALLVAGQEPGLVDLAEAWWKQEGLSEAALRGNNYKVLDSDAHATLTAAENSQSYTIVPLSVFLTFHQPDKSKLIFDKDISMYLPYEALIHNSTRCNSCDLQLARQFINYLDGPQTQSLVLSLGQSKFKTAFFLPPYFRVYRPR